MLKTLRLRNSVLAMFMFVLPMMAFAGTAVHDAVDAPSLEDNAAATDSSPAIDSAADAAQGSEALTVAEVVTGIDFLDLAPQLTSQSGYCQARSCQTNSDCDSICSVTSGLCTWVPVLCPNNPICLCFG